MSTENNLGSEISEAAESVQEEAAGKAADAEKIAEEATDAVEETAEDVAEKAEEAAEDAAEKAEEAVEETAEKAEEAAEDAAEKAEEAAEDIKKKAADTAKPVKAQAASKSAPVIKKKKGINTTTLIVIIVCAVVVLACLWYVGFKLGWWHIPTKANYTIAAHDTIEISESDLEITDDSIEPYITSFQSAYETTEEVTEGTVEDGDTVYISYVGKLDGEEFDGGSSDGYELEIGSGTFIDGFEDGLIGVEVGETVDLNLTFPEDYGSEELAGQDVVFTVTVIHKDVTNTPEFTDDFVKENSAEYTETRFGESTQIDTVEDYRSYVYDYLYDIYLEDALGSALEELIEVKTYDEEKFDLLYAYAEESLEYYASYYGIDMETMASYYGYESSEEYLKNDTEEQLRLAMLYSDLAAEIGITHTSEDVDASITEYMEDNGLTESYTLEDFKSLNGEAWLYMYENYQMNYEPVIEAMKERVVIVPATEEETEEESVAE